jgi:hypothetical protein
VVLLNILGSIQVKHGELHEVMQVFELACKDASPGEEEEEEDPKKSREQPQERPSIHNIATIEAARSNSDSAFSLYSKVLALPKNVMEKSTRLWPLQLHAWVMFIYDLVILMLP